MRRRIISAFTIAETNTPKTADHRLRSPTPDPPDPPRDLQALQALQEMATKPKLRCRAMAHRWPCRRRAGCCRVEYASSINTPRCSLTRMRVTQM
jgi:hypothetical protein